MQPRLFSRQLLPLLNGNLWRVSRMSAQPEPADSQILFVHRPGNQSRPLKPCDCILKLNAQMFRVPLKLLA